MALRLTEKPSEPARRLFGTDGIRGVANSGARWPTSSATVRTGTGW